MNNCEMCVLHCDTDFDDFNVGPYMSLELKSLHARNVIIACINNINIIYNHS